MNLFDNLTLGLVAALQLPHLLLLLIGCVFGALAGAVKRVGLLAMLAMLLPVLQQLDMLPALMLIVGVYCGANGGVPVGSGGAHAQMPMASAVPPAGSDVMRGAGTMIVRAAPLVALLAGLIGAVAIVVISPLLIEQAFRFGPAEYFSLMAFGLIASVVLAPGSLIKAIATLVLGAMLSQISVDPTSGLARFNFDVGELKPGLGLIPMAMGVAVIARVSATMVGRWPGSPSSSESASRWVRFDLRHQWAQLLRGAAFGSLLGPVPGGVRLGGHVAFGVEDSVLRHKGAVGVDPVDDPSATAAIVAAVRSSFVPLLAWGFPVNASLALLAGVMISKQVIVGPQLMTGRPELFWGSIAAVALASVLLFLGGGLIGRLALKARNAALGWLPALMVIYCCIGAYTVRNAAFDIFVMAAFALLGHWLFKFGCRVGPLILGFVLGPALESNLRHALELSEGSWGVLVTRPISAGLLLAAAGLICAVMLPSLRLRRARIFDQED